MGPIWSIRTCISADMSPFVHYWSLFVKWQKLEFHKSVSTYTFLFVGFSLWSLGFFFEVALRVKSSTLSHERWRDKGNTLRGENMVNESNQDGRHKSSCLLGTKDDSRRPLCCCHEYLCWLNLLDHILKGTLIIAPVLHYSFLNDMCESWSMKLIYRPETSSTNDTNTMVNVETGSSNYVGILSCILISITQFSVHLFDYL